MRLLISVTDAHEAAEAVAGGADIVDVKDPAAGALGLAATSSVRDARRLTPADRPVTAALGDGPFVPEVAARLALDLARAGASYVKLGLRDTGAREAVATLQAVKAALAGSAGLIVAGFADFARVGAPDPLELPELASAAGAQGCLVDTAVKDGRGLFAWLDDAALRRLVVACRSRGLTSGLAGSLRAEDLPRIAALDPDILGIRGAACAGDRVRGRISARRVEALVGLLRREGAAAPAVAPA